MLRRTESFWCCRHSPLKVEISWLVMQWLNQTLGEDVVFHCVCYAVVHLVCCIVLFCVLSGGPCCDSLCMLWMCCIHCMCCVLWFGICVCVYVRVFVHVCVCVCVCVSEWWITVCVLCVLIHCVLWFIVCVVIECVCCESLCVCCDWLCVVSHCVCVLVDCVCCDWLCVCVVVDCGCCDWLCVYCAVSGQGPESEDLPARDLQWLESERVLHSVRSLTKPPGLLHAQEESVQVSPAVFNPNIPPPLFFSLSFFTSRNIVTIV